MYPAAGILFLDELWAEFNRIKGNKNRLLEFHKKLRTLAFLDPACGCGNFLVISYRELRLLELEVLKRLHKKETNRLLDIKDLFFVDVDQFYGIEIEEFPAQIAQVALWLTDHQMNMKVSEEFGQYFARLPLKKSPHIVHDNALRMNWEDVVRPADLSYIVGNPPFIGKKEQKAEQKADMDAVFRGVNGAGILDYVTAWYIKAVNLMEKNPVIETAFVSTNSITQGEQVGIFWGELLKRGAKINFAHRTFQWTNEASGMAAVHCVIIGFALHDANRKKLYDYDTLKSDPHQALVKNINPYLVEADNILIQKRTSPICSVPAINKGSEATDFGHLILSAEEKQRFLDEEPQANKYISVYMGGEEFINNIERYCLWLVDLDTTKLNSMPKILERVKLVKEARLASDKQRTKEWAAFPTLFSENRQPNSDYLVIPKVSSEKRAYVPIGFLKKDIIASGSLQIIPNAGLYHFGILSSAMHMGWMRYTAGRMKSDYQYSNSIVYNNFPWPEPTDKQRQTIEKAAQAVLDIRAKYLKATLADLYNSTTMPPDLVKVHNTLDKAVDEAYGKTSFKNEAQRVAFLFELYQKITSPLALETKKENPRKFKAKKTS